jgi:hypothetical protein
VVRRLIIVSSLIAGVAISAFPMLASAKKPFSGNICGIPSVGALAAAHIGGHCVKVKTVRRPVAPSPPSGTLGQTTYAAQWGKPRLPAPSHWLYVEVTKFYGSGRALPEFRRTVRRRVLTHGTPVSIGHPGSLLTATSSCMNAPTFACTRGQLLALVGNYFVAVALVDALPTNPGAEPGADEAQRNEQRAAFNAHITAIARLVVARL